MRGAGWHARFARGGPRGRLSGRIWWVRCLEGVRIRCVQWKDLELERSGRSVGGHRTEKNSHTFGDGDDNPVFEEGHCHGLEEHDAFPTGSFTNEDPADGLLFDFTAHAFE